MLRINLFVICLVPIIFLFNLYANNEFDSNTYINTDNIEYDNSSNKINLSGITKINTEDINLISDSVIIDYDKDTIEVRGGLYLNHFNSVLSGENLNGDIKLSSFKVDNVNFIYNDKLKIDSKKSEKNENDIIFYDNFLTPCKLDGFFNCPTWSLRVDKTIYNSKNDKFKHFDTLLRIADTNIIYIPYLSHYGTKAGRQKGFLTPSINFEIKGDTSIELPYYLPLSENVDFVLTPNFVVTDNLNLTKNYSFDSNLNVKNKLGEHEFILTTIKDENESVLYSTGRYKTKQTINPNTKISSNLILTNSKSKTRSINESPLKFEDIFIKIENYNRFLKNDYFVAEISSVESYDISDTSLIPLETSLDYFNSVKLNTNTFINNSFDISILRRDESDNLNPNEVNKFFIENRINNLMMIKNNLFYNNLSIKNVYYDYAFSNNSLNRNENKTSIHVSSENKFKLNKNLTLKNKFIHNSDLISSNNILNEDSNSITFNYTNQFSDHRFFGDDLSDTTTRIVYGAEYRTQLMKNNLIFKINQSFDFNEKSEYLRKINQNSNFSDYAIEIKNQINRKLEFRLDTRLNYETFSKEEMNYNITLKDPIDLNLNYNETSKEAFNNISNDTKSLNLNLKKDINTNSYFFIDSNLDLKNNYSPYYEKIGLAFFDECTKLELTYENTRFNDQFNTSPKETIGINFYLDYLGFFNVEENNKIF